MCEQQHQLWYIYEHIKCATYRNLLLYASQAHFAHNSVCLSVFSSSFIRRERKRRHGEWLWKMKERSSTNRNGHMCNVHHVWLLTVNLVDDINKITKCCRAQNSFILCHSLIATKWRKKKEKKIVTYLLLFALCQSKREYLWRAILYLSLCCRVCVCDRWRWRRFHTNETGNAHCIEFDWNLTELLVRWKIKRFSHTKSSWRALSFTV